MSSVVVGPLRRASEPGPRKLRRGRGRRGREVAPFSQECLGPTLHSKRRFMELTCRPRMHFSFEIKSNFMEDPRSRPDTPRSTRRFNDLRSPGWRTPHASRKTPQVRARNPHIRTKQISTETLQEPQISLDNASYKLYYVNYEIGLDFMPFWVRPGRASGYSPLPIYFLSVGFANFCWASS